MRSSERISHWQQLAVLDAHQLWQYFSRPLRVIAALAAAALTLFVLLWLSNLGLLAEVLLNYPLDAKWQVLSATPQFLATNYTLLQAWLLVIFSLLQGINLVLLVRVLKLRGGSSAFNKGSQSGVAVLFAAGGAGCAACGTSILTPLVATASSGAIVWAERFGIIILIAGIVLLAYSIHKLLIAAPEQPK